MPKSGALPDEMDVDLAIRAITADAAARLASALHSAGPLYDWEDLLPEPVARLIELLLTTGELSAADRLVIAAATRRCAHDWVPLQELELCCQIVVTCAFRHLWEAVRPRACLDLLRVCARTAAVLPVTLTMIRRAYIEEMGRMGERPAEELVIAALLDDGDAAALAGEAGIAFPEPSVVVCVTPVIAPGEAEPAGFGEVPRALRDRLTEGALCAPTPDQTRLVAVLPARAMPDPESEPAVRLLAAGLVEACHGAYGQGFVAGMATTAPGPGDAAAAAQEAMAVGDLLARTGAPGRAGFLLDAVAEAMIAERPDLRRRLTERLAQVRARTQLWTTLQVLYGCDLDRGRTARWLGIHRSTLDYRLNCVERLTSVSPTSVRGIALFSAGLVADALGP